MTKLRLVEYRGKTLTLKELSAISGHSLVTIRNRLDRKWPIERVVNEQVSTSFLTDSDLKITKTDGERHLNDLGPSEFPKRLAKLLVGSPKRPGTFLRTKRPTEFNLWFEKEYKRNKQKSDYRERNI